MKVSTVCKTDTDASYIGTNTMLKKSTLKNLFVLCFGFMLLFSAFMALSNLQSTMNNVGSIGVTSLTTIYGAMIASCLLLPKLVINKVGCKWTTTISALTYIPYMVANLYPAKSTLLPASLILGVGASLFWTSYSTYINQLGFKDGAGDTEKTTLSTSMFFGISQMTYATTQIWGNLVSFYVFRSNEITTGNQSSSNYSVDGEVSRSCGAKFCGDLSQMQLDVSMEQRYLLIGIYCSLCVASAIMFAFFLDPLIGQKENENRKGEMLKKLTATFRQLKNIDQKLIATLTIYCGLQQGFLFSDFTEAFVACALGLDAVGLVFVSYGVVSSITGICVAYASKYVPRVVIMTVAAFDSASLLLVLRFWSPSGHRTPYFLLIGFWAITDGILESQLNALYGTIFREHEEAAFASGEIFRAVGFLTAFACNSLLCTESNIYLLLGCLCLGMVGYFAAELRRTKI